MSTQEDNGNNGNGVLAVPPSGTGAQKLHEKVGSAMDNMTGHVLQELDELIAHIEEIKKRVKHHAARTRLHVDDLFSISDQALAFRVQVKSWLDEKYSPADKQDQGQKGQKAGDPWLVCEACGCASQDRRCDCTKIGLSPKWRPADQTETRALNGGALM